MSNLKKSFVLNLQMFADGAESGTAVGSDGGDKGTGTGATAVSMPATSNPAAKNGAELSPEELKAEFEKDIKGRYKEFYDAKMQDAVQRRLKKSKGIEDAYNELLPSMNGIAKRLGVEPTDIQALKKAIDSENSSHETKALEAEALEKGMPIEELRAIKNMERENAEYKQRDIELAKREAFKRRYDGWVTEGEKVKAVYPSFDFSVESQNEDFRRLLNAGVPVKTAYEVIHNGEIIPAAMQYASQQALQQAANDIAANGLRPSENGIGAQSPATVKTNVSNLTREERDEIERRVMRGEKVSFG